MRLHDALGDGETEARCLRRRRRLTSSRFARTNFSKMRGRTSAGMPGPSSVTRNAIAFGVDRRRRSQRAFPAAYATIALPITLPIACSTSVASARTSGRSAGKSTSSGLCCAAPARGADHAFDDLAQIDPVAPQFQRAGIDPRDGQQIAHHVVEPFGLVLDLAEQVLLRRGVELVAVVDQAGGRAENRRQRRAEIVRDRSEQRVAHALGLGRGSRARPSRATSEARSSAAAVCSASVSSSARASESSGRAAWRRANADDAERPARVRSGTKNHGHDRQRRRYRRRPARRARRPSAPPSCSAASSVSSGGQAALQRRGRRRARAERRSAGRGSR